MNIWTCKSGALALVLLGLAGCDAPVGGGLFANLAPPATPKQPPVTHASLSNDAIKISAPSGFCIDGQSIGPNFALMARCDALGAARSAAAAPLGLITVSVLPSSEDGGLPNPAQIATAANLAGVSDTNKTPQHLTFRAKGRPPLTEMSETHWRGATLINGHVVAVTLYGPDGGEALSEQGRQILTDVIARCRESS